jgi:hypothetical protein
VKGGSQPKPVSLLAGTVSGLTSPFATLESLAVILLLALIFLLPYRTGARGNDLIQYGSADRRRLLSFPSASGSSGRNGRLLLSRSLC